MIKRIHKQIQNITTNSFTTTHFGRLGKTSPFYESGLCFYRPDSSPKSGAQSSGKYYFIKTSFTHKEFKYTYLFDPSS